MKFTMGHRKWGEASHRNDFAFLTILMISNSVRHFPPWQHETAEKSPTTFPCTRKEFRSISSDSNGITVQWRIAFTLVSFRANNTKLFTVWSCVPVVNERTCSTLVDGENAIVGYTPCLEPGCEERIRDRARKHWGRISVSTEIELFIAAWERRKEQRLRSIALFIRSLKN